MNKALVVLLLAGSAAVSAWAQGPQPAPKTVGKLINVEGLVTVSSGQNLANAVSGAPMVVGNRIITTSSGAVTLNFDNGCDVRLKANQSITVNDSNDCAAILAGVQAVGAVVAAAPVAAAGSSLLVPGLLVAGGAIAIVSVNNNSKNTSPN